MGLSRVWVWVGVTCWFFAAPGVRADVRLARIFGDNMVLQQRRPVPVMGHCGRRRTGKGGVSRAKGDHHC